MKRILFTLAVFALCSVGSTQRFSLIPRIGLEASYVTPTPIMLAVGVQLGYAEGSYQARIGIETNLAFAEVSLQADAIYTFYAGDIQGYFGAGGHQVFYDKGEEDRGGYLVVGSRIIAGHMATFLEAQPIFRLNSGFRLRVVSGVEFAF